MRILTDEQMKMAEQRAADNGIEFIRLMENAGSACARIIKEKFLLADVTEKTATIVCGNGKNGGDGFVIARKLCQLGCTVNVVLAKGLPRAADAVEMFGRLKSLPVNIYRYDLKNDISAEIINKSQIIVDSVFGTGFYGCPDEELSLLFTIVNKSKSIKISIDIPSGVECNKGLLLGECIKADLTIAISCLKPAHVLVPGSLFCGEVIVADIGISEACYKGLDAEMLFTLNEEEIKKSFLPLSPLANKGDFGHVLSICGSRNMQGAAVLAAKGAVYAGAGLVTAAFPASAYTAIAAKLTEPLLLPLNSNSQGTLAISALPQLLEAAKKAKAVLIGCGIGLNADTKEIVKEILNNVSCPIIIDADGINALCGNIDILKAVRNSLILTPHPGEMARLTGVKIDEIQSNRVAAARKYADDFGAIMVLKGANTVVAEPHLQSVYINSTGNPGMATGGSGDLLAGIMAAFVAQGMAVGDAARTAVYIHGLAGDIAAKRLSMRGLTPTACLEVLPLLLSKFETYC